LTIVGMSSGVPCRISTVVFMLIYAPAEYRRALLCDSIWLESS
jgi:hypothetical protein